MLEPITWRGESGPELEDLQDVQVLASRCRHRASSRRGYANRALGHPGQDDGPPLGAPRRRPLRRVPGSPVDRAIEILASHGAKVVLLDEPGRIPGQAGRQGVAPGRPRTGRCFQPPAGTPRATTRTWPGPMTSMPSCRRRAVPALRRHRPSHAALRRRNPHRHVGPGEQGDLRTRACRRELHRRTTVPCDPAMAPRGLGWRAGAERRPVTGREVTTPPAGARDDRSGGPGRPRTVPEAVRG